MGCCLSSFHNLRQVDQSLLRLFFPDLRLEHGSFSESDKISHTITVCLPSSFQNLDLPFLSFFFSWVAKTQLNHWTTSCQLKGKKILFYHFARAFGVATNFCSKHVLSLKVADAQLHSICKPEKLSTNLDWSRKLCKSKTFVFTRVEYYTRI